MEDINQNDNAESASDTEQRLFSLPKNLISNPEQALEAMGYIEGKGWLERQKEIIANPEPIFLPTSIAGAQQFLTKQQEKGDNSYCVYGVGGGHRYFVMPDGEIIFDAYYAQGEGINKARRIGFKIREK